MKYWKEKAFDRERYGPYLYSAVAVVFWCLLDRPFPNNTNLFSAGLSLGAIFAAFIATIQAITVSLNNRLTRQIQASERHRKVLIDYLHQAVLICVGLAVISILGFFIPVNNSWYNWFGALWLWFCSTAFLTFYRSANLMRIIMLSK